MSNLRRKIQNIEIEGKEYILAFDMTSVDIFQDLSEKGVLQSFIDLNKLEDKAVLNFIASTLRPVEDKETPLGWKLYTEDFDLLTMMIALVPTIIKITNEGFPKAEDKGKKQIAVEQ